jgi:hypothetical protein
MTRLARLVCMSLLLLPGSALSASASDSEVAIGIRVIYAVRDKVHSVDPALEDIRDELAELPASKFRLLDRIQSRVVLNSSVELQLPGSHSIAVRFNGIDRSSGKTMLSLQLSMKPALKINLRLADGGRTLLGGPSHLEGKLILDISAKLKEVKK